MARTINDAVALMRGIEEQVGKAGSTGITGLDLLSWARNAFPNISEPTYRNHLANLVDRKAIDRTEVGYHSYIFTLGAKPLFYRAPPPTTEATPDTSVPVAVNDLKVTVNKRTGDLRLTWKGLSITLAIEDGP